MYIYMYMGYYWVLVHLLIRFVHCIAYLDLIPALLSCLGGLVGRALVMKARKCGFRSRSEQFRFFLAAYLKCLICLGLIDIHVHEYSRPLNVRAVYIYM